MKLHFSVKTTNCNNFLRLKLFGSLLIRISWDRTMRESKKSCPCAHSFLFNDRFFLSLFLSPFLTFIENGQNYSLLSQNAYFIGLSQCKTGGEILVEIIEEEKKWKKERTKRKKITTKNGKKPIIISELSDLYGCAVLVCVCASWWWFLFHRYMCISIKWMCDYAVTSRTPTIIKRWK